MRERVRSSGGDPDMIADEPAALWRLPKVMERTSLSRATLYRLIAAGQFPKGVRLSEPGTAF
jgi:predicted DNA-binding transcriptional regulator AlpA